MFWTQTRGQFAFKNPGQKRILRITWHSLKTFNAFVRTTLKATWAMGLLPISVASPALFLLFSSSVDWTVVKYHPNFFSYCSTIISNVDVAPFQSMPDINLFYNAFITFRPPLSFDSLCSLIDDLTMHQPAVIRFRFSWPVLSLGQAKRFQTE